MLNHLSITNYAIIEKLELYFSDGFSVITGETGAGKSILLGALSLILGKRADTSVLKNNQKKCIIEGCFRVHQQFADFFNQYDLDFEEDTIIRREINVNGKSRAFVNDTPVNLNVLKALSNRLIDIHSQHETLFLKNNSFQLNVIDAYANNQLLLEDYQTIYKNYKVLSDKLNNLIEISTNSSTDEDYIHFQVSEIEELELKENEKEDLEKELELINNAEDIKRVLDASDFALNISDSSLTTILQEIEKQYAKITQCSTDFEDLYRRIMSTRIELDDIAKEIDIQNSSFEFNPERLAIINDRLSKIYAIEQKHKVTSTSQIFELLLQLREKLTAFSNNDEEIKSLENELKEIKNELIECANELSESRLKIKKQLEQDVITKIADLGMNNAKFILDINKLEQPTDKGIDEIEFLFSANKGMKLNPLSTVASGGELSRIMLTFKSILIQSKKLPTIIFDEIDAGVSGDIADKMASIMSNMSTQTQVIAITHLPQVAAKGQSHFKVYKEDKHNLTLTNVKRLTSDERVEELAKMLSGKKLTEQARENAKVLLSN